MFAAMHMDGLRVGAGPSIPSSASHNPSHKVGGTPPYGIEPPGLDSEDIQVSGLAHTLWTPWVALEKGAHGSRPSAGDLRSHVKWIRN